MPPPPEALRTLQHALASSARLQGSTTARTGTKGAEGLVRAGGAATALRPGHGAIAKALGERPFSTSSAIAARVRDGEGAWASWGWCSPPAASEGHGRRRHAQHENLREKKEEPHVDSAVRKLRRALFGSEHPAAKEGGMGRWGQGWDAGKSPWSNIWSSVSPPPSPPAAPSNHLTFRTEHTPEDLDAYLGCGIEHFMKTSSSKSFSPPPPTRPFEFGDARHRLHACVTKASANSRAYANRAASPPALPFGADAAEAQHPSPSSPAASPPGTHAGPPPPHSPPPHAPLECEPCPIARIARSLRRSFRNYRRRPPSSSSASSSHRRAHANPNSHSDYASSHAHSKQADKASGKKCEPGWVWYLVANERRRRDPGKRWYFRHALREFEGSPCQLAAAAREAGAGGREAWCRGWQGMRERWRVHRQCTRSGKRGREELKRFARLWAARKAGRVLSFRDAASRSGSAARSFSSTGAGPFNYDSFRESLWYARMHGRMSAGEAQARHGKPRFREIKPELWIIHLHVRQRMKGGLLYFMERYSPDGRLFGWSNPARPRHAPRRRAAPGFFKAATAVGRAAGRDIAAGVKGGFGVGVEGGTHVALGKVPAPVEHHVATGVTRCHLFRNELYATARRKTARPSQPLPLFSLPRDHTRGAHIRAVSRRAFSTSPAPRLPAVASVASALPALPSLCPAELGLHVLLLPLTSVLKSSAALNVLTLLTRASLTLLPLSLRGRVLHALKLRSAAGPLAAAATAAPSASAGWWARANALYGLPLLLAAPVVMLALVALASLERTPVTGRWRVVMLSPAEEAELVSSVLTPSPSTVPEGTSRDWVAILRRVLALPEEGVSPSTGRRVLLGGEVLDQRDWRVRWAAAVLAALEKGGEGALVNAFPPLAAGAGVMNPPPTNYPLHPRAEHADGMWKNELVLSKHLSSEPVAGASAEPALRVAYDLLVIDRPDANAFSFGFGPDYTDADGQGQGKRGVIVVYTGFIDEVLSSPSSISLPPTPPPTPPSRSRPLFSTAPAPPPLPEPIQAYLTPAILPSQAQTKALAVLLSHELAHLCLDHTIESHASTGLLVPHLARLGSDVLRTMLYPLTALLGPFLNDALGRSLNEAALDGFGVLGQAVNSCSSRKLEGEADRVALRLLASSGIDPHFALSFWEDRLASSSPSSASSSHPIPHAHVHPHSAHSGESKSKVVDGLLRSHPVDEERVVAIREELRGWERWWAANGEAPAAAAAAAA
ncbi:hypothetical protein JCM10213_000420 [Rhodosporidiobolus nylandii]